MCEQAIVVRQARGVGGIVAAPAGEAAGARDLITVDIGGTSCDIALIEDGVPALRSAGGVCIASSVDVSLTCQPCCQPS